MSKHGYDVYSWSPPQLLIFSAQIWPAPTWLWSIFGMYSMANMFSGWGLAHMFVIYHVWSLGSFGNNCIRWVLLLYVIAQHLEPWPEIWWCFGYSHNPLTLCLVHFATHIHAGFFCFFGYLYGYCLILGYVILSYIYNQQWSVYLLLFCLFSSLLNWGSFCICLRHMEGDHI